MRPEGRGVHRGCVAADERFLEMLVTTELVAMVAAHGADTMHHEARSRAAAVATEERIARRDAFGRELLDEHSARLGLTLQQLNGRVARVQDSGRWRKHPVVALDTPEIERDDERECHAEHTRGNGIASESEHGAGSEQQEEQTAPCAKEKLGTVCVGALFPLRAGSRWIEPLELAEVSANAARRVGSDR